MKRYLLVVSALFLISTFSKVHAQKKSPMVVPGNTSNSYYFLDHKGSVLFTLDKGEELIVEESLSARVNTYDKNYSLFPFRQNICVVKSSESTYYLLNRKGKVQVDFGNKYSSVSAFKEGYSIAREKIEGRSAFNLIFIDSKGNEAFDAKRYWEADPFSDRLAVVQEIEGGSWEYINSAGVPVINISEKYKNKTLRRPGSFKYGLASLNWTEETENGETSYESALIDKTGDIVWSLDMFKGDKEDKSFTVVGEDRIMVSAMRWGRADSIYIVNRKGDVIFEIADGMKFLPYQNGKAGIGTFRKGEGFKSYLVGLDGEKKQTIGEDGIRLIQFVDIKKDLAIIYGFKDYARYFSYSFKNERIEEMDALLHDFQRGYYLTGDSQGNFSLIKRKSSKTIWSTPVSEMKFASVDEVYEYKEQATDLTLTDLNELDVRLSELRSLKKLTIYGGEIEELDEAIIGELSSLEELSLSSLSNLKKLPESLKNLKRFSVLYISDCESIRNLPSIVEGIPSLKELNLVNIDFPRGFKNKMKELNPNLEIFDIYMESDSMIFDEGE